jgi:prephenate dehydrogenase
MAADLRINHLSECRVAIVGLGLMGGSMALALQKSCHELIGVDSDANTLEQARSRRIISRTSARLAELLPEADLIVLAIPVRAILDVLEKLPALVPGSAMVLDLGSTKAEIVQKMSALPDRFDPLGGHPMCGKEKIGIDNAEAEIYQDAPFALTPLPRSSATIRKVATELVEVVGARPVWIDAEMHDNWVARTSHVPFMLANALAAVIPEQAASLIGPGLRSTTRLAATPWSMMGDILATNRTQVLAGINDFHRQLALIERLLEKEEYEALENYLAQGAERYENIIR